jgi:hypothetical protein
MRTLDVLGPVMVNAVSYVDRGVQPILLTTATEQMPLHHKFCWVGGCRKGEGRWVAQNVERRPLGADSWRFRHELRHRRSQLFGGHSRRYRRVASSHFTFGRKRFYQEPLCMMKDE